MEEARCENCGEAVDPRRLVCPHCGVDWQTRRVASKAERDPGKKAFIWGLVGLVLALLLDGLLLFWIGPAVSAIGIHHGVVSRRLSNAGVPQSQDKATAGIVCGVIGVLIGILKVAFSGGYTTTIYG